jgi:hypothetical protein
VLDWAATITWITCPTCPALPRIPIRHSCDINSITSGELTSMLHFLNSQRQACNVHQWTWNCISLHHKQIIKKCHNAEAMPHLRLFAPFVACCLFLSAQRWLASPAEQHDMCTQEHAPVWLLNSIQDVGPSRKVSTSHRLYYTLTLTVRLQEMRALSFHLLLSTSWVLARD